MYSSSATYQHGRKKKVHPSKAELHAHENHLFLASEETHQLMSTCLEAVSQLEPGDEVNKAQYRCLTGFLLSKLTGGNPDNLQKVLSLKLRDVDACQDGEAIDISEVLTLPTDVKEILQL